MAHSGGGGRYIGNPLYDGLTDSSSATAATTSQNSNSYPLPHNANLDLNGGHSSAVRRRQAFYNAGGSSGTSFYDHTTSVTASRKSTTTAYKRQASDDPSMLSRHYGEYGGSSGTSGSERYETYLRPPGASSGYARSSFDGSKIGNSNAVVSHERPTFPRHHSIDSPYRQVSDIMRDFQTHTGSQTKLIDPNSTGLENDDYGQLYETGEDSTGSNGGHHPLYDYGTTFEDEVPPPAPAPASSGTDTHLHHLASSTSARTQTASRGKIMELYKTTTSRLRPNTYPDYHMMDQPHHSQQQQQLGYPMTTVRSTDSTVPTQVTVEGVMSSGHETFHSSTTALTSDNQQPQLQPFDQQYPQSQQQTQAQVSQQQYHGSTSQQPLGPVGGQMTSGQQPPYDLQNHNQTVGGGGKNDAYWKWNGTAATSEINYNNNTSYLHHSSAAPHAGLVSSNHFEATYLGQYSHHAASQHQYYGQQQLPYSNVREM